MTVSRRLLPDQTYSTTRRTSQKERLLLPKEPVNEIALYALGRALEQNSGVRLHAYTTTKTHDHGVLTDRTEAGKPSEVPHFFQQKNSLAARALNAHYGRSEPVWRPGSYGSVEIHDQAAIEAQLLYTWVNNVKDGQVRRPEDWPGPTFLPEDFGKEFVIERPKNAFWGGRRPAGHQPTDEDALAQWEDRLRREELEALQGARDKDKARGLTSKRQRQLEKERRRRRANARERERLRPKRDRSASPDRVTIKIHPPPGYEDWPIEEVRAHFRRLLDAEVARVDAQRQSEGKPEYVGAEAILKEDPRSRGRDAGTSFKLNPRVACKDRKRRSMLLIGLVAWRKEVALKRDRWREGNRDVVFPRGVYGLWRFHGALVEGAAPPS